jgi:glycosyltransferase involved in cell wall biosynthesis
MSNRQISVVIPHYNNTLFIKDTLAPLIDDNRINEIIICDDKSNDFDLLKEIVVSIENNNSQKKIKLYQNDTNLGCYHNKLKSISYCSNDWAILLDSDNIYDTKCLDILFNIKNWETDTIYAPMWAKTFPGDIAPNLNYSKYKNIIIDKNIYLHEFNDNHFQCLINTCNYFLPVKPYIGCMSLYNYNRTFIDSLDSAVLFTDWLYHKNKIYVVDDLIYKHRLHSNSNYMISSARRYEGQVKHQLFEKIRSM